MDARVRHDPRISVVVSGRIEGRAPGGMADTMRRRMLQQDEFTDDRIQPAFAAFRKLEIKRGFTELWRDPDNRKLRRVAELLSLPPDLIADAMAAPYFGLGWSLLERSVPPAPSRSSALWRVGAGDQDGSTHSPLSLT